MPTDYSSDVELDGQVKYVLSLHEGEDNGIDRWSLVAKIFGDDAVALPTQNDDNTYDRQVRNSVERLRAKGNFICNRGNSSGYYIAKTREEYEQWKRYYLGAALRKLQVISTMDDKADQRWGKLQKSQPAGQVSMLEVA